MQIETPRLKLRSFTPDDLDALAVYRGDAEVMRYITVTPQTREQVAARMEKFMAFERERGYGIFALEEKAAPDVLIGWCGLFQLDQTDEIEIGYGFGKEFWGKGYATEAANAALRFGFEHAGLERIVAVAIPENEPSQNVMRKLGMSYEKEGVFYGNWCVYYAIERDNFTPLADEFQVSKNDSKA